MATILLYKPQAGSIDEVGIGNNITDIEFTFDIGETGMRKVKNDFEFSFSDGSIILLKNFYTVYNLDFAPNFHFEGMSIPSVDFFDYLGLPMPGSLEALYDPETTPTLEIAKLAPASEKVIEADKSVVYIEINNDLSDKFKKENDDFILTFKNNATLRLKNFYKVYDADSLPALVIGNDVLDFNSIFSFIVPDIAPEGFFEDYSFLIEHKPTDESFFIAHNSLYVAPEITFAMLITLGIKTLSAFVKS